MRKLKFLIALVLLAAPAGWAGEDLTLGVHQIAEKALDGSLKVRTIPTTGRGAAPRALSGKKQTLESLATHSVLRPRGVISSVPRTRPARPVTGGAGTLASMLWVDRNSLRAICSDVAISGTGRTILAGWYLNRGRTSCYLTAGNGTPLWAYPFPQYGDYVYTGASGSGQVLSAVCPSDGPTYKWNETSPFPNWSYNNGDPGARLAVSRDGSRIAVASSGNMLYILNAATGDTVFTTPYNPTRSLSGVDLSTNGSVVLVSTEDSLEIWRNGVRVPNLPSNWGVVNKVSGDGNTIVRGGGNTVNTYRWNGSSYASLWGYGFSWMHMVRSLDISADGNWVIAGTWKFTDDYISEVAFFNISSGTPRWQYHNYKDQVTDVAVSDTGGYAIAGSLGDFDQTFGDVISIFARADSTPIFSVPSTSEPGSCHAVDISADGSYATAGGKEVHDRVAWNGGYVYAFQIRTSSPPHDVAPASLDSPPEFLQVAQSITPQATYTNLGTSTESFPVALEIFDSLGTRIYNASGNVTNLPPGGSQQVSFSPNWTVPSQGWFRVRTFTQLGTDQFPGNDTLTAVSRCWHDVGVQVVVAPFPEITINHGMAPRANVVNLGTYTESFPVYYTIRDTLNNLVYADTAQVSGLAPYDTVAVFARTWTPTQVGTYTVRINTAVPGDWQPQNDTQQVYSVCTYEIIYDDGRWNMVFWPYRHNNDKVYARFTPTISPPFDIIHGRIFMNVHDYSYGFDYVMICPSDSFGKPDTANPLSVTYWVRSPSTPAWADFDLYGIHRTDANDLWMVAHWADSDPYFLLVGADTTSPLEYRSYWSSNQDPYQPYPWGDFMMRLLQSSASGVKELSPSGVPLRFELAQNAPNPWGSGTSIRYALPQSAQVALRVYNPLGQLVRTLVNGRESAGSKQVAWDGRDERGSRVPSGIYFYRLQAGGFVDTRKMVIVR